VFRFSDEDARRMFGDTDHALGPVNVYFGHAQDPDSLESATAKAAWLDEAGQGKFKLGSWQAVVRRLSIAMGHALLTTVYNLGWLKSQVWDRWKAGDEDYEVVNFESAANPLFPPEEFARANRDPPRWKFDMQYRGLFTRPAGLIYGNFKDGHAPDGHKVPRFELDPSWPRHLGLDFGGVNTVGLFYAEEPDTNRLYLYREYRSGGLPVQEPPIRDVEVGIDRVYGAFGEPAGTRGARPGRPRSGPSTRRAGTSAGLGG
jgi:hypothetical protein